MQMMNAVIHCGEVSVVSCCCEIKVVVVVANVFSSRLEFVFNLCHFCFLLCFDLLHESFGRILIAIFILVVIVKKPLYI